jgi:ketosteroid isomerase-like protein
MRHRYLFLVVVAMFVQGDVRAQRTPTLSPAQEEVWKVSQACLAAFNRRDLDAFARFIADDFIGSTDDGIFMSKARLLRRLSTHPPESEQRKNVRDIRVRVHESTAIANYRLSLTEEGFENGRLIFELRRTEVFQKNNDTWLMIAAHDSILPINHREPAKVDPKTLKDYSGQYEHFHRGFMATYTVEGDHLFDEWKGDKIEAFPMAKDTFFEREDLGWVTFNRDAQGRVTGYTYHYADGQVAAGKKVK